MKGTTKKRTFMNRFWRLLRNLIFIFFLTTISWVLLTRFLPVYITPLMMIRTIESVFSGEMPRNSKTWTPIGHIFFKYGASSGGFRR